MVAGPESDPFLPPPQPPFASTSKGPRALHEPRGKPYRMHSAPARPRGRRRGAGYTLCRSSHLIFRPPHRGTRDVGRSAGVVQSHSILSRAEPARLAFTTPTRRHDDRTHAPRRRPDAAG